MPHCLSAGERKRGFVLPIVIFALAIMGVLVAAGATMTQDDRQGSLSVQEGTRSFYAAEAGLNGVVANWSAQQYDTLVVAGGSTYSYFGHEEWRPIALEVKSLDSALEVDPA